jgi:hypothetical protein
MSGLRVVLVLPDASEVDLYMPASIVAGDGLHVGGMIYYAQVPIWVVEPSVFPDGPPVVHQRVPLQERSNR